MTSETFRPSISNSGRRINRCSSTGTATYANSGTSSSANFGVLAAGDHTVYARIIDKDDGFTPYSASLTVGMADLYVTATANSKTYGDKASEQMNAWIAARLGTPGGPPSP